MDPVPVLLGHVKKAQAAGDPGVIDQNVNLAEGVHGFGDHGLDIGQPAHIGLDEQAATVVGADLGGGLLAAGLVNLGPHHMGALPGVAQRDRLPHPGPDPGDKRDFVLE